MGPVIVRLHLTASPKSCALVNGAQPTAHWTGCRKPRLNETQSTHDASEMLFNKGSQRLAYSACIGGKREPYLVHDWGATIHNHRADASLVGELASLIVDLAGQLTRGAQHKRQWVRLLTAMNSLGLCAI